MYSARYFCETSMKLEFSWQTSEKYLNILVKIRPVGSELFPADGQTDRQTDRHTHDEANGSFSQFCERAKRWQGQVKHLGQCFLLKSLWRLAWKDVKDVECLEMEMEAVMTPNKQVFKGMQKRQRNQISPLSSRNLQSSPPPCSLYPSIAPTPSTPHSSVHQDNCSCVCWS